MTEDDMSITFKRVDALGMWAVCVSGDDKNVRKGDRVKVERSDGSLHEAVLGDLIGSVLSVDLYEFRRQEDTKVTRIRDAMHKKNT